MVAFTAALSVCPGTLGRAAQPWHRPALPEPLTVKLSGLIGDAFERGVSRLGQEPYTAPFILADVSFSTNRWFTNYSGDISGRFLELASLVSFPENPQPAPLTSVMEQVPNYQKSDGHFGAEINWTNSTELHGKAWDSTVMPVLWGNGRLLLGLTANYARFHQPRILEAARKLGDFYVTTAANTFCDPNRTNEYTQVSAYAGAYVTCYFEGMEGLVQLYRLTADKRYLNTALRMADFHEQFDTLPVGHSHGSLSQHEALLMLYEETGNPKYLSRVAARWDAAVQGGYVSPAGGVLEKFVVTGYNRDEGCSEADWLRLSLMLWRNTGQTRYLDMAERTLWNEYFANQWPDGGYGHRFWGVDDLGPYAFHQYSEEALWCCTFHGPLAIDQFKSYAAVEAADGIFYNFPVDFLASVTVSGAQWTVLSHSLLPLENVPVRCEVKLTRKSGSGKMILRIRQPEWAEKVVVKVDGGQVGTTATDGYVNTRPLLSGAALQIEYHGHAYLETRRFERVPLPRKLPASLDQVVVRYGPNVLLNNDSGDIETLNLQLTGNALQLPKDPKLISWSQLRNSTNRHAFVFNVQLSR